MNRVFGVALLSSAALVAGALAGAASATTPVKLPKTLTSATGNFFTLYTFDAPTSTNPVASALVKVCTSAHTPKDTAIDPELFTLKLTSGGAVALDPSAAHEPALTFEPLKPLQCVKGWLSFKVPAGKHVADLVYDYNGAITWAVG